MYGHVYGRANFTHAIQTLDNKTQMSKRTPGFLRPLILSNPSCISQARPSHAIRAPTPRDARAFPLLPMCRAVLYVDRIFHAQRPPMQGCLYSLCVLDLRCHKTSASSGGGL